MESIIMIMIMIMINVFIRIFRFSSSSMVNLMMGCLLLKKSRNLGAVSSLSSKEKVHVILVWEPVPPQNDK